MIIRLLIVLRAVVRQNTSTMTIPYFPHYPVYIGYCIPAFVIFFDETLL